MPKLITREEMNRLKLRPVKRGRRHPLRDAIENLEVGQLLRIAREEMIWKNRTPAFFCNQISKHGEKKFTVHAETNKTGWVVERVK